MHVLSRIATKNIVDYIYYSNIVLTLVSKILNEILSNAKAKNEKMYDPGVASSNLEICVCVLCDRVSLCISIQSFVISKYYHVTFATYIYSL